MTAMTVFVLLITLFCIYTVLDGFDIGTGIALPFLNRDHKREALSAIWPFWDGNEVWGIMGGAVLFAGFPSVYATALPLLYIPLILIIAALIIRSAVFEVRFHDEKHAALWEWMFTIASAVIAASFGFALQAYRQIRRGISRLICH
jgi:cytochrome d ubiquinol oxidase subunit II